MGKQIKKEIGKSLLIVIAVIVGGTGLDILYNAQNDLNSLVGGFALIGIAIAIIYNLIR